MSEKRSNMVVVMGGEFYVTPISYEGREARESYKARVRQGLNASGEPGLGLTKDEALRLASRLRSASKRNRRRRRA